MFLSSIEQASGLIFPQVEIRNKATLTGCYGHYWRCESGNCGYTTRTRSGTIDSSSISPVYSSRRWCESQTVNTVVVPSDKPFQLA